MASCSDDAPANDGMTSRRLVFTDVNKTVYAIDGTAAFTVELWDADKLWQCDHDMKISAEVADGARDLVVKYNYSNRSEFALMPETAVTFSSSTIANGESRTSLNVKVDLAYLESHFDGRPFMLPVKIVVTDGHGAVNADVAYLCAPIVRTSGDYTAFYCTGTTPTAEISYTQGVNDYAVVCNPGGGYSMLLDSEIEMFRSAFAGQGVAVAIVRYRMPAKGNYTLPAQDAYNTLCLMRANREKWGGYKKVGIMGGSAGGHLSATVSTYAPDEVDFQILLYPVITMNTEYTHLGSRLELLGQNPSAELERSFSFEYHVTSSLPPTFVAYSMDDGYVDPVHNAQAYITALKNAGVHCSESRHETGGHQSTYWTDYPAVMLSWLKQL